MSHGQQDFPAGFHLWGRSAKLPEGPVLGAPPKIQSFGGFVVCMKIEQLERKEFGWKAPGSCQVKLPPDGSIKSRAPLIFS